MLPDWVVQSGLTAGTADSRQSAEAVAAAIAPVIRALFGGGRTLNVTFTLPSDQAEVDPSNESILTVDTDDTANGLEDIRAQLKAHAQAMADGRLEQDALAAGQVAPSVIDVPGLGRFRLSRLPNKGNHRLGGKVCLVKIGRAHV